jgi:hypothetical protein
MVLLTPAEDSPTSRPTLEHARMHSRGDTNYLHELERSHYADAAST